MRPTTRPAEPYTLEEIKSRIYTHFFVENNPQCTDAKKERCLYSRTGCAVGCLITAADAARWDENCKLARIKQIARIHAHTYSQYFSLEDLHFLQQCQNAHDSDASNTLKELRRLVTPNN